jgi:hypothetical protein
LHGFLQPNAETEANVTTAYGFEHLLLFAH